jgi:hypothetical protein
MRILSDSSEPVRGVFVCLQFCDGLAAVGPSIVPVRVGGIFDEVVDGRLFQHGSSCELNGAFCFVGGVLNLDAVCDLVLDSSAC